MTPIFRLFVALCLLGGGLAGSAFSRAQSADAILAAAGVRGGLLVHIGCGDGTLTCALAADARYLVHGLDPDPTAIAKARDRVRANGLTGRVTLEQWDKPVLPYADGLVNLVVGTAPGIVSMHEVMRVLSPGGVAYLRQGSHWERRVKPRPATLDEWPQFFHDSTGNAVSKDRVCGPPHRVQWIAGPRWARSHEHLASISAVVTSHGRLFCLVDNGPTASVLLPSAWALVARDAFSGVRLWERRLPSWEGQLRPFRSGPAALPRRLAAAGDSVYVTLGYGAPVSELDGATGRLRRTFPGTVGATEIVIDSDRLFVVAGDVNRAAAAEATKRRGATPPPHDKRIVVLRATDGAELWRKADSDTAQLLPLTLAVADGRLFFQNPRQLICLDAASGKEFWRTDRPVATRRPAWSTPTLVVSDGVVLSADRAAPRPDNGGTTAPKKMEWLVSWAGGGKPGELIAFSAETGQKLWSCPCQEGYTSPVGVFVIDGLVWTGRLVRAGDPGIVEARDLKTGKVKRTRPPDKRFFRVGMAHHRCYRDRATDQYLLLGRAGIEFVDVKTGTVDPNHWVRGACQFGILPANGLVYAPSHSCACYLNAKLNSFNALAPKRPRDSSITKPGPSASSRIEPGPAWGEKVGLRAGEAGDLAAEWPTYAARSGSTAAAVSPKLGEKWRATIGGRLSSPIVAAGRVWVAEVDAGTIHAFDVASGREVWRFATAGRIDSPPSFYEGRVVFGSADGRVYCVRADDGRLIWRFRAGPEDRRIVAYNAVESAWPVHGSVLILPPKTAGDTPSICFAAGRSTYLDGGIFLYRLNLYTGEIVKERRLNDRDPQTGLESQKGITGLGMKGVLPDVLSAADDSIFMRHARFAADSLADRGPIRHLFSPTGFLDDTWWHRSYWLYGTQYISGWGGWWRAGNRSPSGRILVMNDAVIYGFGRTFMPSGNAGQWAYGETYRLFSTDRDFKTLASPTPGRRRGRAPTKSIVNVHWQKDIGMAVRALVLAGKDLFAAGPLGDVRESRKAFRGENGAALKVIVPETGELRIAWRLPAPPVFDGMAAAEGRLFVALTDGTLACLAEGSERPLSRVAGIPNKAVRPPTPRPEIGIARLPAPLPPLPNARENKAFQTVSKCVIGEVDSGFRIAADRGRVGLVLRALSTPITRRAVFRMRIRPVPGFSTPRFYRNGFLAFGDGTDDGRLVKCGLKFLARQALIMEGPTNGTKATASERLSRAPDKAVWITVSVDLNSGKITFRVGKKTLQAVLRRKPPAITYVGYAVLNAVTDFGPIEITGE
ncbi:MAG: PQQ-binding-like beta-propeller repeat protein [Kiritimatiellaeota bacterium]|nr:PQQ-binding-like beta-propeller repeat protein [Kiritimatiellota bacterium]